MTESSDTYTEAFRSGQDAVVKALEKWTDSAKSVWANAPGVTGPQVEPQQVIDQVFDFAEKMLSLQREFAKSLAATTASATAAAREQTESVVGAVRQHTTAATEAVKSASKSGK